MKLKFNLITKDILFFLLFFLAIYLFTPSLEENRCKLYGYFRENSYSGVISLKAIDTSNHGYPYIQLQPDIGKIYLDFDINGVFDSLKVNDEITKLLKSDSLKVIRDGKVHYLEVNYGCIK